MSTSTSTPTLDPAKVQELVTKLSSGSNERFEALEAKLAEQTAAILALTEKVTELSIQVAANAAAQTIKGKKSTTSATNGEKVPKAPKAAADANKLPSNNQQLMIKQYSTDAAERTKILEAIKASQAEAGKTLTDEDIQKVFADAKSVTSKPAGSPERLRAEANLLWKDKGVDGTRGALISEKMRTDFRTQLNRLKVEAASSNVKGQLKADTTGGDAPAASAEKAPEKAPVAAELAW